MSVPNVAVIPPVTSAAPVEYSRSAPHDMRYQAPPAPAQTLPAGAPPQAAPAAPQAPPAPQAPAPLPIPPELQGKSAEEQLAEYMRLRNHYEQTARRPLPAPQQDLPAGAPVTPPQGMTAADFWADPVKAMESIVERKLQPVTGNAMMERAMRAKESMKHLPGFQALEQDTLNILQSVDPAALGDPQVWNSAYRMALGAAISEGRSVPGINAPTAPVTTAPSTMAPPANNTFVPAVAGFFSEGTRSSVPASTGLSAAQAAMAAKMNMTPEQYSQWAPK